MDFCWSGLRQAGACVKSMCACLCVLILGGPILLIVGIVLLVADNTREQDVKDYNSAVAAYDPNPVSSWRPGVIQAASVSLQTQLNPIVGNMEGITVVGVSTFVEAYLSASSSYLVALRNVSSFTISGHRTINTKTVAAHCDRSNGCSRTQMGDYCEGAYGSSATYAGTSCSERGTCGMCNYDEFLSSVCAVVTSTFPFTRDSRYSSCYYPFGATNQKYATSSSGVSVSVRKSDDPYIALQRLTQGTDNFGLTAAQQRTLGLVLLIIGAALIGCVILIACLIVHLIKAALAKNQQVQPQPQQQVYPVAVAPAQVIVYPGGSPQASSPINGGYGAPPPGYAPPPQQPGYGYGAPQPGYGGQPQPGYGQPQPGYGQPQPPPGYAPQPQQGFNQPPPALGYPVPQQPQDNKVPNYGY